MTTWTNPTQSGKTLIDSYSESNVADSVRMYNGATIAKGQSFKNTDSFTLDSCKFYLHNNGTPPGNVYAKLYSHSGTYGTSSVPGTLLATSDAKIASSIGGYALYTFDFSGAERITLSANTYYVIVVYYNEATSDHDNCITVGYDSSSPTALGNSSGSNNGTSWTAGNTIDLSFYVYGKTLWQDPTKNTATYTNPSKDNTTYSYPTKN